MWSRARRCGAGTSVPAYNHPRLRAFGSPALRLCIQIGDGSVTVDTWRKPSRPGAAAERPYRGDGAEERRFTGIAPLVTLHLLDASELPHRHELSPPRPARSA